MISSLVLNSKNDIAFFYGEPLGYTPKWASIDMELGELYIVGNEDNDEMRPHKLDKIDEFVYLRLHERRKVLLVQVEKNDIRKPVATHEVPLMVPGVGSSSTFNVAVSSTGIVTFSVTSS